ncbi:nucleotidyltransferase domain-containing protein [Actinoplanes sp. NPDC089786]|uniref:nucleotidyltransferase domain-containing protein n=1 Tax=Actinoplanes sp. NPDC089786 TaxID=3155185 RepID=UPI003431682B
MDSAQPQTVAESYLAAVDAARPGLVERLYLVGSAALGAWQPGVSDVDAIIFTSRPLTDADLAVLPTTVDGPYLAPELHDLWPVDRRVVPFVVGERRRDPGLSERRQPR